MIKKIFNRIKKILGLPTDIWQMFISYLPGDFGYSLRYSFWKKRLRHLGKSVRLDTGVCFKNPEYIAIGDNTWIDMGVSITGGIDKSKREKHVIKNRDFKGEQGVVYIGKGVHISPRCILSGTSAGLYISDDCNVGADCKFYAFSQRYKSKKDPGNPRAAMGVMSPHENQCLIEGPIYIGKNVGIVMNTVIFPGVSIPENCAVTLNSVVFLRKFEANSVISGNPAKRIGKRFNIAEKE